MSKKRGAIGHAGYGEYQYAVYPNKITGLEALTVMLKGSFYARLTLSEALKRYEPGKKDYIKIVTQRTGLDSERTISSLSDQEFELFYQAIEFVENWEVGNEDFIERWHISGVHKKKGIIFEYLIDKKGVSEWISKENAIHLAEEKRLHATVVHPKHALPYLRPEFGKDPFTLVA